jgi:transposase
MIKENKYRKTYSYEFKLKAVKMHIDDKISYRRVAKELNIHESMIIKWCKKFNEFGCDGLKECRSEAKGSLKGRPSKKELTKDEQILKLKVEVEYLKKLLRQGRL